MVTFARHRLMYLLLSLALLAGCGSNSDEDVLVGPAPAAPQSRQIVPDRAELHFAVLEGELSELVPSREHEIFIDPAKFRLPTGQALLKLTAQHEADKSVRIVSGPVFIPAGNGLLGLVQAGSSYRFTVSGRGEYRVLISLAGDVDGDGDVESSDLALLDGASQSTDDPSSQAADLNGDQRLDFKDSDLADQNLGHSTSLRPLDVTLSLDPVHEPLAPIGETEQPIAWLRGQVSPGASVSILKTGDVLAQAEPISVDANGEFVLEAPVTSGENTFTAVATDEFGQRAENALVLSKVEQASEKPAAISADKQNRIWLLDVHANNYLFRGPLPLDKTNDEAGRVDFPTLIRVMNQRLLQQGAPIETLPTEFKFTEVALITNRSTTSKSHGDEGFSLHLIYQTILGGDLPFPADDETAPASLFTRPLDNEVADGPAFQQAVDGKTYTIHPSVSWQALSGNGDKVTTLPGNAEALLKLTFPIVFIAPNSDTNLRRDALSNSLSNLTVATRYLHGLMEQESADIPHIIYFHCVNGHDRTGMLATAYVLSAYGESFEFDLPTAYKYGQMGQFLPGQAPQGVDDDINYWQQIELQSPGSGALKKNFIRPVLALTYLYSQAADIAGATVQDVPQLTPRVPEVPLWSPETGFVFAESAESPTVETQPDFLKVRP